MTADRLGGLWSLAFKVQNSQRGWNEEVAALEQVKTSQHGGELRIVRVHYTGQQVHFPQVRLPIHSIESVQGEFHRAGNSRRLQFYL
jgi:hypothetical protein